MNKEHLLSNLQLWSDCLENPSYHSLEVGFRHNPVSKDEIINRYKQECDMTRENIERVITLIKRDGIIIDGK